MQNSSVAVCSRSFSRNKILKSELLLKYKNVKFNDEGLSLSGNQLIDFVQGYSKTIIGLEKMNEDILKACYGNLSEGRPAACVMVLLKY